MATFGRAAAVVAYLLLLVTFSFWHNVQVVSYASCYRPGHEILQHSEGHR